MRELNVNEVKEVKGGSALVVGAVDAVFILIRGVKIIKIKL